MIRQLINWIKGTPERGTYEADLAWLRRMARNANYESDHRRDVCFYRNTLS